MSYQAYCVTIYPTDNQGIYYVASASFRGETYLFRGATEEIGHFGRILPIREAIMWLEAYMRQDLGKEIEFWRL